MTDAAEAVTPGTPAESYGVAAAPSIGVPSIPARRDETQPATVPSLCEPMDLEPPESDPSPSAAPDGGFAPGAAPEGGFAPGVAAKLRSYVYLLVDARSGRPFFVGRGRDDRCFRHLSGARRETEARSPASGRRRFSVEETIGDIESGGSSVRIDILRHGLSPVEAATVEAAVAEALGIPSGSKLASQRRSVAETNAALAKPVRFKRAHQVVVRRFDGAGEDPGDETVRAGAVRDEAVRHGWHIDPRWTDLDSPRSPQWAVVATGGLVSAVYRIEGWEPGPAVSDGFSLVGRKDPVLQARYVGRSVSSCPPGGSAGNKGEVRGEEGALSYVGCGPNWVAPSG